jgi:RNA polymerase sigma-70 factor (ECF subfamily)
MRPQPESIPAHANPKGSSCLSATSLESLLEHQPGTVADFDREALPHMDDLYRTSASMLRNRTEADDAVQETYLQAWRSFHRFTPGTNCRAWLFRILFHVVAHQRRKWYSRFVPSEREELEQTTVYSPPLPEELTDEDILSAVRKIPQHYAEVLLLADVHEFSYREIQEMLSIPIGTVMSRLSRGRHQLRAYLPKRSVRPVTSGSPAEATGI